MQLNRIAAFILLTFNVPAKVNLEISLSKSNKELDSLRASYEELKSKSLRDSSEKESVFSECKELKVELLNAKTSNESLALTNAELSSQLDAIRSNESSLRSQIADVATERDTAVAALSASEHTARETVENLRKSFHERSVQNSERQIELQEQLDVAVSAISARDDELSKKNQLITTLSSRVAELQALEEVNRAEIERLTAQLQSELASSEARKQKIKKYVDSLLKEKEEASSKIQSLDAMISNNNSQIGQLNEALQARSNQVTQLQQQVHLFIFSIMFIVKILL